MDIDNDMHTPSPVHSLAGCVDKIRDMNKLGNVRYVMSSLVHFIILTRTLAKPYLFHRHITDFCELSDIYLLK